jgi:hypothetical protein
MPRLRYTLLSDGTSDRALMPILDWLIEQMRNDWIFEANWADLRRLPRRPEGLVERLVAADELYPCEILFVHRDAERDPHEFRLNEVTQAWLRASETRQSTAQLVRVVPVRMQEAWLLIDEQAIRAAAGNPNGDVQLNLPRLRELEGLPDPKSTLHAALRQASGLHGRRLSKFAFRNAASRVTTFIRDFAGLRQLPAFQALEKETTQAIEQCTPLPD